MGAGEQTLRGGFRIKIGTEHIGSGLRYATVARE